MVYVNELSRRCALISLNCTPRLTSVRWYSSTRLGAFSCTIIRRRPRAPKANPNETASGRYDKSFEKLTAQIEERLPFSQKNVLRGSVHDRLFGEESEDDMKKAAQDDLHGREDEKPAAKMARSYFSDEDLSPEALHVRSPRLRVSQNLERQKYDKKLLNTSSEPIEYYYLEESSSEKKHRFLLMSVTIVVCCTLAVLCVIVCGFFV